MFFNIKSRLHTAWISLILSLSLSLSLSLISLSLSLYRRSYPVGLTNIQCPHRADVNKFLLVGQHWHVYV